MNKPKKHDGYMSGVQRMQRRKLLAHLVSLGQGIREVAERYGLTEGTVRSACNEYGVDFRFRKRGPSCGVYAGLRTKIPINKEQYADHDEN